LIYTELLAKKINPEDFFSYTASRLRQIGKELEEKNPKDEF
jgi:hypothetical protein